MFEDSFHRHPGYSVGLYETCGAEASMKDTSTLLEDLLSEPVEKRLARLTGKRPITRYLHAEL
jgi:hypothetical protein